MDYDEIVELVVTELTEKEIQEYRKTNPEVDNHVKELVVLSEQVQKCTSGLNAQAKETLEQYSDLNNLIIGAQIKHLYLQGAKDCVRLLKALEVI